MYTKKQHITRKTIITLLAFASGMVSTVLAAAVYDASVQSRTNTIFDSIKQNASSMNQTDSAAYYQLVRLNIKSLIEVLTAVDGKIVQELAVTIPGLDNGTIIGQITNSGNNNAGSTTIDTAVSGTSNIKKQRIFIKFNRSLPSTEYSREENECGIPIGKTSCTITMEWYSSPDARTMELYSSVNNSPFTLLQSALISSRTLTLNPSTETKIRFTSNPDNQVDEIVFKGLCVTGSKWNGTSCIAITNPADSGFTSTVSEVLNNVAKVYTYQVNEGMQVSEYVDATEELARRQCADRQNYFNNALAIKDKRDIKIRCTWKGFEFFSYTPANDLGAPSQLKNITGSMEEIGRIPEKATNNRDYFFAYLDNSVNPTGDLAIITEAEAKVRCQQVHEAYPKSSLQCTWRGIMFNSYAKEPSAAVNPTSPDVVAPTSPVVVGPTSTTSSQLVVRRQQIADLYRSVLGREPDEPGLNYWVADSMTIEQIRANFQQVRASEQSQENTTSPATVTPTSPVVVGPTVPVAVAPVVTVSPRRQQISDLYRSILGREPDEAGLNYWVADSMTIDQIRENFLNSPEYQQNNR